MPATPRSRRRLPLIAIGAAAMACGTATDPPPVDSTSSPIDGAIRVEVSAVGAAVTPGGAAGPVTVKLARSGEFFGTVTLSAEGLPAGVSASFNPATIGAGANNSLLTLAASGSATPGNFQLTVRAHATGVTGVPDATAALAVTVAANDTWLSIAAGIHHTCGRIAGLVVRTYCWGLNVAGALGDGTTSPRESPTPVQGGHAFSTITLGGYHTCGLTSGGQAFCWGWNDVGQLGDRSTADKTAPEAVAQGGETFTALNLGAKHTCGLSVSGTAYCWGSDIFGESGDDGADPSLVAPTIVRQGAEKFTTIAAGQDHTCALTAAGAAYCWGNNQAGELGDATTVNRTTPTLVGGGFTFSSIGAGRRHTCALTTGGQAFCWGINDSGQVGDGTTSNRSRPTPVVGGMTFTMIALGYGHTCGLDATGQAFCWGSNANGGLGDGTREFRVAPTPVQGELTFLSLAVGGGHTCGLTTGRQAYCWGVNTFGQIGDGTTTSRLLPALVPKPGSSGAVVSMASSGRFSPVQ